MDMKQLLQELKDTDNLLPQDILKDTNLKELATQLKTIFESNQQYLETDLKFRTNFTELVNYIYLSALDEQPDRRKKKIFSDRLITFLLATPSPAV